MTRKILVRAVACVFALLGAAAAQAQTAPTKVAIINIQDAITRTQEGQKMAREMQEKYLPTSQRIDGLRKEIEDLRSQLNKGANTMSDDARRKLARDIQSKERALQRDNEDAQAAFNQEQQGSINDIGAKLMTVIDQYSREQGYSIVLDISSPQSPVLFAINEVNITNQVIELYDQKNPVQVAASTPAATAPATP